MPVWLGASLYQCCGQPFAVGEQVSWRLVVDGRGALSALLGQHAPTGSTWLPVLATTTSDPGEDHHDTGVVVGAGDLRVFVSSRSALFPADGQDGVRAGLLVEDHHGAIPSSVPATVGRVEALAEVRVRYTEDGQRGGWVPQAGSAAVQQVGALERWPGDGDGRQLAGWLVTLDVAA